MRRFRVTVNGIPYEVGVEEILAADPRTGRQEPTTPVREDVPAIVRPAVVPTPPAVIRPSSLDSKSGGTAGDGPGRVEAPLPGAILAVKIAPGDTVVSGQVLMLLEAMKMENEVVAPVAGRVASVRVQPGDSVSLGDLLCVLEEDA